MLLYKIPYSVCFAIWSFFVAKWDVAQDTVSCSLWLVQGQYVVSNTSWALLKVQYCTVYSSKYSSFSSPSNTTCKLYYIEIERSSYRSSRDDLSNYSTSAFFHIFWTLLGTFVHGNLRASCSLTNIYVLHISSGFPIFQFCVVYDHFVFCCLKFMPYVFYMFVLQFFCCCFKCTESIDVICTMYVPEYYPLIPVNIWHFMTIKAICTAIGVIKVFLLCEYHNYWGYFWKAIQKLTKTKHHIRTLYLICFRVATILMSVFIRLKQLFLWIMNVPLTFILLW